MEPTRDANDRRHAIRRTPTPKSASRPFEERRRRDRRRLIAGAGLAALGAFASTRTLHRQIHSPASLPQGSVEVQADAFRLPTWDRAALEPYIQEAAAAHGVAPDLVRAVIQVESQFNPLAVSPVGARGLMQLMPGTARDLGVSNAFDPRQNVLGGVKYLSSLLQRFDGNVALALAGYNAGPEKVARFRGVPPYRETQGYVRKIHRLVADTDAAFSIPKPPKPKARVRARYVRAGRGQAARVVRTSGRAGSRARTAALAARKPGRKKTVGPRQTTRTSTSRARAARTLRTARGRRG